MRLAIYRWLGVNFGDQALEKAVKLLFPSSIQWIDIDLSEKLNSVKSKLSTCEGIVVCGGTIIGNMQSWILDEDFLDSLSIPVIIFGTGIRDENRNKIIEPFLNSMKILLDKAHPVLVRGPLSREFLKSSGVRIDKVNISGDPALLLGKLYPITKDKPRIGTGINIRFRPNNGEIKTINFIKDFLSVYENILPKPIQFFSCHNKWDLKVKDYISKYDIIEYTGFQDSLENFLNYELVISERLHGTIIGQAYNIPAVQLNYERKCEDHFKYMEISQLCIDPQVNTIHDLMAAVNLAKAQKTKELIDNKICNSHRILKSSASTFVESILLRCEDF